MIRHRLRGGPGAAGIGEHGADEPRPQRREIAYESRAAHLRSVLTSLDGHRARGADIGRIDLIISLGELNGSGHLGMAWLGSDGDQTDVVVNLVEPDEMD